jgi:adenosylmethionine-8-amino-7-oxononanoate aminotransferase
MNVIPSNADLVTADKAHLVHPLTRHRAFLDTGPVLVVAGKGAQVQLADGQWLVDGSAGLWCVNVGHGRAELARAASDQMLAVAFTPTFGGFSSVPAIRLAERLADLAPGDLEAVFFTSGGSEANESAIKFARYYWRLADKPTKTIVISHERGYHGLAHATTSATGLTPYHQDFGPSAADFVHVAPPYSYRYPASDADQTINPVDSGEVLSKMIEALGANRVAAVIVEPVLGTGG